MKQHTILAPITIEGVGLHTGVPTTLTILAADSNYGFKFKRTDLEKTPIIAADANKVLSTNRSTTLGNATASVSTVEHLLSALTGCGVDNALIEIDGPEVPILDGSAALFVEAIQKVGLLEQDKERNYLVISEPIHYKNPETGTELIALPADDFQMDTMIDFNSSVLGNQYASLSSLENYVSEIAPCRTFVFVHELEHLLEQNLIKGGDLDNAIVIANEAMTKTQCAKLAAKLGKKSIKIQKGILNTTNLAFDNEPARHKLLDVMGDLALVGARIKGRIIATKPGHSANIEFAKLLKKQYQADKKLKGKPKYDPTQEPLYLSLIHI